MNLVAPVDLCPAPVATEHAPTPLAPPRLRGRTLAVLGGVGVVVALLTWRLGDLGPAWLAADAAIGATLMVGLGGRAPGRAAWLLAAASFWMALWPVVHASDWAQVFGGAGSVMALAALGLVLARKIPAARLAEVLPAGAAAVVALPRGFVEAAKTPREALDEGMRASAGKVLKGLLLGAPVGVALTVLLAADRSFRHAVQSVAERAGDGVDLAAWAASVCCLVLLAATVLRRIAPRSASEDVQAPMPYRVLDDARPTRASTPRVAPLTWAMVLGQVGLVFAVYVAANARSLFAGHERLQARGTWTYASYLHEGFMEVSVAALLAVACVVAGHVLLRARDGSGAVPGGRRLAALEIGLLALVAITLASCAHRLSLYEEAYGYTYLRLGVWFLQLGVAGLLAMTAAQCARRAWRGWGSALAWAAVAFTSLAAAFDADGWIARHNAERALAGRPLDVGYLAGLSEDAAAALPALRAANADGAAILGDEWSHRAAMRRAHGWRTLRGF